MIARPQASALALALLLAGCAFVPRSNARLEEARSLYRTAHDDAELVRLAPGELARAGNTLHLADAAWSTLDDAAVVDHLAYLAKQRLAIARAVARKAAAEEATRWARIESDAILSSQAAERRRAGDPTPQP